MKLGGVVRGGRLHGHALLVSELVGNWRHDSAQRARAVAQWLADHGVDPARLDAEGFGETQPVADNQTAEGREQNRRIEFRVVR